MFPWLFQNWSSFLSSKCIQLTRQKSNFLWFDFGVQWWRWASYQFWEIGSGSRNNFVRLLVSTNHSFTLASRFAKGLPHCRYSLRYLVFVWAWRFVQASHYHYFGAFRTETYCCAFRLVLAKLSRHVIEFHRSNIKIFIDKSSWKWKINTEYLRLRLNRLKSRLLRESIERFRFRLYYRWVGSIGHSNILLRHFSLNRIFYSFDNWVILFQL